MTVNLGTFTHTDLRTAAHAALRRAYGARWRQALRWPAHKHADPYLRDLAATLSDPKAGGAR